MAKPEIYGKANTLTVCMNAEYAPVAIHCVLFRFVSQNVRPLYGISKVEKMDGGKLKAKKIKTRVKQKTHRNERTNRTKSQKQ